MKDRWQKIINILTLLLLIVCFVKIGWLQNDIQNLKNTVNNNRSMLQSSIDSISSNVRYEMEQANNLLSDSSWNTGGLDVENKTATLYCYVVPKVYNPEKTFATIIHNGNEVPMTLENGRYVAEFAVSLFDDCNIENVQFREDGTIRTQQLNWMLNPRYDLVPTAYVYYSGESKQNYEGEKITRSYKGAVEIDFEHFDETAILETKTAMPDRNADEKAVAYLEEAMKKPDSVGGVMECKITGVPAGIGDPVFEKLDANLAKAMMSIGAVKP